MERRTQRRSVWMYINFYGNKVTSFPTLDMFLFSSAVYECILVIKVCSCLQEELWYDNSYFCDLVRETQSVEMSGPVLSNRSILVQWAASKKYHL